MKTVVAAALTSAFLIGGAYADSPSSSSAMASSSGTSTDSMAKSGAKRDMAIENHIKDLHAQLQITPAEESQWAAVAKTMRDNAIQTDKAIAKREALVNGASAVDNLHAYGDIAAAHAEGVKRLAEVFTPLYDSMSDDQKKVADAVFAHRPREGKKTASN